MKWQLNTYLYFFVGRLLLEASTSSSSSFITTSFLIQMLIWIRGSSRFESFVFLIAWGSLIFSFSHLFFSYYESSFFFFPESAKSNHFLLAHISCMNESYDLGKPFKVAITTFALSTSSSTVTSCSLIWDTLVTYDCMVTAFWIFTFFNWFLKVIF